MSSDREVDRLTSVYREYVPAVAERWSAENAGNRMIHVRLRQGMARLLAKHRLLPLNDCRILDVGCGYGSFLAAMQGLGAREPNLHGVDLLSERIEGARRTYPSIDFRVGNGESLPYESESFDLVMTFTVFTSILDSGMRANVAAEMRRVLRSNGAILWYDFRYDNPWNRHVRAVRRADLAKLFAGFELDLETITVLPQLARRLGRSTPVLYPLLAGIPPLRTHYLGLLVRDRGTSG